MRRFWLHLLMCSTVPLALACRGRAEAGQGAQNDNTAMRGDTTRGMTTDTGRTAEAGEPGGAANLSLGKSIFEGKAANGICYTCHAPNAKGTQVAPDLTDNKWLNGDGSLAFIERTVREGVAKPKQYPAAMPPFKAQLNDEQVKAVAAYVHSLSHPNGDNSRR